MTIAENLQELIDAKADMKAAIAERGVTVAGGLSTYADAIRSIEGSGIINTFDLTVIGYDNELNTYCNKEILDDIEYSKNILDNWDPTSKSGYYFFSRNYPLVRYAPLIDTSNITGSVSLIDGTYLGDYNGMRGMFEDCRNLEVVPLLNTENVVNMQDAFSGCTSLKYIPQFDTSNVITLRGAFYECESLITIPLLNTKNVTTMCNTFLGCLNLMSLPLFDTSNVINMKGMLQSCENLTELPPFNTSNVINMQNMLTRCFSLTSLPLLNCGNVEVFDILQYSYTVFDYEMQNVEGFKDLGKKQSFDTIVNLSQWQKLTHESCINIFNNLYNRKRTGYSVSTIQLHQVVINKLTDADIAIATNKGWTISS